MLSLSASGFGNDGEPGEGDTTDAENLNGGTGRNIITGDARANRLEGGPTFDIITSVDGIGGNDVIIGHSGAGTDVCQGDAGPPRTRCTAPRVVRTRRIGAPGRLNSWGRSFGAGPTSQLGQATTSPSRGLAEGSADSGGHSVPGGTVGASVVWVEDG